MREYALPPHPSPVYFVEAADPGMRRTSIGPGAHTLAGRRPGADYYRAEYSGETVSRAFCVAYPRCAKCLRQVESFEAEAAELGAFTSGKVPAVRFTAKCHGATEVVEVSASDISNAVVCGTTEAFVDWRKVPVGLLPPPGGRT